MIIIYHSTTAELPPTPSADDQQHTVRPIHYQANGTLKNSLLTHSPLSSGTRTKEKRHLLRTHEPITSPPDCPLRDEPPARTEKPGQKTNPMGAAPPRNPAATGICLLSSQSPGPEQSRIVGPGMSSHCVMLTSAGKQ
ncbi:hypothetical protein CPLU01_05711 [Colletotrichum plurivorum]|uniref:Uncharacterized protein n=1 Tax=Colletotrichum plurivorum TaxID=2175906 RepID=A0A8H6NGX3_9PEZI|nr:hypothetical protein CPLU01_05711 [Colletotrichum plurivorum]